jgi:mono/diheme cytochrome c family protein
MYVVHCASCHGIDADGHGTIPMPDPSRMSFHNSHKQAYITLFGHAPANWYTSIEDGPEGNAKIAQQSAKMPAFGKILANEQIWLLVTYLEEETLHPGFSSSLK